MPVTRPYETTRALDLDGGELRPVSLLARDLTGRRPSSATISRWCGDGTRSRGRLPALHVFGCWHTTREALQAWLLRRADRQVTGGRAR